MSLPPLFNPVKCTGADSCPVCNQESMSAPAPAKFSLSIGGFVKVPAPLQTSEDLKDREVLAKRIIDLCREFGVTGMSGFAAQAVAKELIESEKKAHPFQKVAAASENATKAFTHVTSTLSVFGSLAYNVPPSGVLFSFPYTTANAPAEASIQTFATRLTTEIQVNKSKPLYLWEEEAWKALNEQAKDKGLLLITRAHLVAATVSGDVSVMAWAIPLIQHFGPPQKPENYGSLGDWKKYGLHKLVGPEAPPQTSGEVSEYAMYKSQLLSYENPHMEYTYKDPF